MPGRSGGVALNVLPTDEMYEALGGMSADEADADGMYADPVVDPVASRAASRVATGERPQTVYAPDFSGGGEGGEMALYDAAAGGGYAYADTGTFAGFSGAVRMTGGYSEPRPIARLPSSRPPAVPGRPSLKVQAPSAAPAAPGWVRAVLALYGLLFCVAFGLLGARGALDQTVTATARDIAETAHEIVGAVGGVGALGFVGQVGFFATTAVPSGWIICDGRSLNTSDFPDLAAALDAGANATAFRVPDMVSGGGLFPRGGLTPGVVQEQSVAVDDLAATVEVWDYANPSAVVPWWDSPQAVRDPDAPRRQTVSQFWYDRTGTRQTDVGLWSYTFPVNFTAGGGNETRPPAIVLVPAIYGGGP
jgi:hypothetical protein